MRRGRRFVVGAGWQGVKLKGEPGVRPPCPTPRNGDSGKELTLCPEPLEGFGRPCQSWQEMPAVQISKPINSNRV